MPCTAEGKEQWKAGRQGRKERQEEKAVNGRYDAQRPSGAGFLSVSSPTSLSLVSKIQPLPSLPQFRFTSPPLHFHPSHGLNSEPPRYSPRPRICSLIDRPGAVGRSKVQVLNLKPCFFFPPLFLAVLTALLFPQYFELSWWFG